LCADFKYEKENIELRRGRVLELLARGHSQREIAKSLNVSDALISLDMQYIKESSRRELETHIQERIPLEYKRAMTGMNNVLKRVSEILDNATDNKTKLEAMKLMMDLYRSIMNIATDGVTFEQAIKWIEDRKKIQLTPEEEKQMKEVLASESVVEEDEETEAEEDVKEEE
jgi:transcriptional regulator